MELEELRTEGIFKNQLDKIKYPFASFGFNQ